VVRRIDPRGETVVSALGVEEQRVPVLLDFTSPREMWTELGTGYRVLARFILWEGDDVLQVPTGALFRIGDGWGVFVVSNGRAELRRVFAGQRSGLSAGILEGLTQGEIVIVHPEAAIRDGTRVSSRE
jgi:HlyD family secretion protein